MPCAASANSRSHSSRRATGSMPAVGSSRNTTRGSCISAAPSASRCFQPPDSRPARRSAYGSMCVELERVLDALAQPRAGEPVDARVELEVLEHREIRIQRELLAHVADLPADRLAVLRRRRGRAPTRGPSSARAGRTGCGSASTCPSRSGRAGRRRARSARSRLTSSSATKSPNLRVTPSTRIAAVSSAHFGTWMNAAMPARSSSLPSSEPDPHREHLIGALVGGL